MTIYLSGKMSGLPDTGTAEFKKYADKYRAVGFHVLSPPEMDMVWPQGDYRNCIKRDAAVLFDPGVEAIYMLPNWRDSKGAVYERFAAQTVGIPVYDAETGLEMETVLQVSETVPEGNFGRELVRQDP